MKYLFNCLLLTVISFSSIFAQKLTTSSSYLKRTVNLKENIDLKVIWSKLRKLRYNLHKNDMMDKKSDCFWCTYGFSNPPNSTVPTTLKPCSIGVIPNPRLENITGLCNKWSQFLK